MGSSLVAWASTKSLFACYLALAHFSVLAFMLHQPGHMNACMHVPRPLRLDLHDLRFLWFRVTC